MLFAEQDDSQSAGQIRGFECAWRWDQTAARSYEETIEKDSDGGRIADALHALRTFLGESDMLAQLAMMAPRLAELRRVLKPTGCIYLHCAPAAGHYLKILTDAVFGPKNFRSEIVWREGNTQNKLSRQLGPKHDTILFYAKSDAAVFKPGRRQWPSYDPTPNGRHWAMPRKLREELLEAEQDDTRHAVIDPLDPKPPIRYPQSLRSLPRFKQYLSTCGGIIYQDIWGFQPGSTGVLFDTDEGIESGSEPARR